MCLSGKDGEKVLFASNESLLLNEKQTDYLKKLESYTSKIQNGMNIELNAEYDKITCEDNRGDNRGKDANTPGCRRDLAGRDAAQPGEGG